MKKMLAIFLSVILTFCSVTCAFTVSVSAEDGNLWVDPTDEFTASSSACTITFTGNDDPYGYNQSYMIAAPYYKTFSLKLPDNLSADKLYRISFDYLCMAPNGGSDFNLNSMYLTKDGAAYGDKYMSNQTAMEDRTWKSVEQEFMGADGELRLFVDVAYVYQMYFRNLKVVEVPTYDVTVDGGIADISNAKVGAIVTITATPEAGYAFEKWQVVSGNVTLQNSTSATTTFTMPEEAVEIKAISKENLWVNPADGFTASNSSCTIAYTGSEDPYGYNQSYMIAAPYYKTFSLKLPDNLSADKLYRISFEYLCMEPNGGSDFNLNSMYLTKDGAAYGDKYMSNQTAMEDRTWKSVEQEFMGADGELRLFVDVAYVYQMYFRNLKVIEVSAYNVSVENGTADKTMGKPEDTITITATPEAGYAFEKWQVVSGNVTLQNSTSATTTFTMPEEAVEIKAIFKENLWVNPADGFTASNSSCTIAYTGSEDPYGYNQSYMIAAPYYKTFSLKLPDNLSADKLYRISFEYLCMKGSSDFNLNSMYLTKDGAAYGDKYMSNQTAMEDRTWKSVEQEFMGADGELRLFVDVAYVYQMYFRNLKVIEVSAYNISVENGTADKAMEKPGDTVTITATPEAGYAFEKWQVVSGNITLADKNSSTTTFIMPEENVEIKAVCKENLWANIQTSDFSDCGGMENVITAVYQNNEFTVDQPWWQEIKFKLPSNLKEGSVYRLSVEHKLRQAADTGLRDMYLTTDSGRYGSNIVSSYEATNQWVKVEYEFTAPADQLYLRFGFNYIDSATFRNFSVICVDEPIGITTAYNNAAALRVAANSKTGKNGLRIYNEIKTAWVEAANIVEFGSIAIATKNLNNSEFNLENDRISKGVAYKQGEQEMILWKTTDDAYIFTSYLTSIPKKNYGSDISVRTYAIDKNGNVYYGEAVSVSVFEVANAIDNANTADGSAQSETDINAFYAFVSDAKAEEYAAWCTENALTPGALYNDRYSA